MHASFALAFAASAFTLASAANHQIVVGGPDGTIYNPSNITAAVGDTVEFIFQSKNHTVTQSAFATPCTHLVNATAGTAGFDSGFIPVAVNATENPAWTLQVTVATPIWHCQNGMVGAINAVATGNKSYADFKALAMSSTANTSSTDNGSTVVSSGVGADATGSLSSVSAPSGTSTSSSAGSSTTSNTQGGAASSVRAGAAGLALTALAAFVVL